jgi:hypothetical protein
VILKVPAFSVLTDSLVLCVKPLLYVVLSTTTGWLNKCSWNEARKYARNAIF